MFDGRIGFREEMVMAERHATFLKQAEALHMLDEIYTENNKRPSRLRGAAGWLGNQLVRVGGYLVSLSQSQNVTSECIEMT